MTFLLRPWRQILSALVAVFATAFAGLAVAAPAQAANIVTPGNFTGYGFDQCHAPSQSAMDQWLTSSPYWAVGIYISGASRGCPTQPNLTPTWVSTQLESGWRLLPITLGPQASCTTRPRYRKQVRINPSPHTSYAKARKQGRQEATKTVGVARDLGIAKGSTLWYDIEAFNISKRDCRDSALSFLSAWTRRMHTLGYVSGIYSSAASGIRMLDDAQANRAGRFTMPDHIWIGDWNGRADVYSRYVRSTSWMPHGRVHQYKGGHNATYGGVTINIDSNFLDIGRGSHMAREYRHCGGVRINFPVYRTVRPGSRSDYVKAAQCLLKEQKLYGGRINGVFSPHLAKVVRSYRLDHGLTGYSNISRKTWMVLTTRGATPLVKYGAAQPAVRRLQRALNAADSARLDVTGVFEAKTAAAVQHYQKQQHLTATGVVTDDLWALLRTGVR